MPAGNATGPVNIMFAGPVVMLSPWQRWALVQRRPPVLPVGSVSSYLSNWRTDCGAWFAWARTAIDDCCRIWLRIISEGGWSLRWQFHAGSIRGLLVGAFYYPWWILAIIGIFASPRRSRTWALAILAGTLLPAIAFSPQFRLPRAAYFAFPAVYLLASAAIYMISQMIATRVTSRDNHWRTAAGLVACAAVIACLAALTNLDLTGDQTFNVWFHEAQENSW